MKKQFITLLLYMAICFGLSAQNIVMRGTIDRAVAGQKVWINYFSSPTTCNLVDSTTTNSSGAFTYSFTIGSGCKKNVVRASMVGCVGIYDTLTIANNYDSTKTTDTLTYTFKYCDTCKTKAAFVGWPDSAKALGIKLYNQSSIANKYKWHFGNGQTSTAANPTYTYSSPGTYNVCLVATDSVKGCKDSTCKAINISYYCSNFKAKWGFAAGSGNTINFYDSSSSSTTHYKWKFGDGDSSSSKNPSHTYSSVGSYNACLIIRDSVSGCRDTLCKNISVAGACTGFKASFNHSLITGSSMKFTSTTSGANKFTWKLGNGYTTTTVNNTLNYSYSVQGPYTVCLTARDTVKGCIDSICKNIYAGTPCTFSANFNYNIQNNYVSFSPSLKQKSFVYYWTFGDGITGANPFGEAHKYADTGTYNVCLRIRDTVNNCADSVCKTVVITSTCNYLNVSFKDSVAGNTAYYTNTSSPSTLNWIWNVSNTSTYLTTKDVTTTYPSPGSYRVSLYAYDAATGCSDSMVRHITVGNCAGFTASFTHSKSGKTVNFTNTSSSIANKYFWKFGDNATTTSKNPSHTYGAYGAYQVTLIAEDTVNGCLDSIKKYVTINDCSTLKASFIDSATAGYSLKLTFNPTGYYNYYKITDGIGNAITGSSSNPISPIYWGYGKPGTYTPCFVVGDTVNNCWDTLCKTITFNSPCAGFAADFSYKVAGNKITVTNLSSPSANDFKWYFGNKTSTVKNPSTITLNPAGVYSVCLVSKDTSKGCIDSVCKSVTIYDCSSFKASFSATVNCKNVSFSNTTSSSATNYSWDFGDATTSTSQNPTHSYNNASAYKVCLIASDSVTGCVDTLCSNLSIGNTLTGVVYRDSGVVADSGMVWLIKVTIDTVKKDTILTPVDSTIFVASSGKYKFNHVVQGKYLLKTALFPGTSFYSNRIPTYYTQAVQWQNATYFNMGSTCDSANIVMVKGTNPGGSGFVGGKVSQGANKVGDPLPKRQVLLFNANNTPYGYTYTDTSGKYLFSNVAFGTYRVQVEVLGKFSEDYNITMTQQNQGNLNGNFDENTKYITLSKTSGIYFVENGTKTLQLYPNPATETVNVGFDIPQNGMVSIQISDITGKLIVENKHLAYSGANTTQLDVSGLANGLYVISIVTGDTHYVGRLSISK